MLPLRVIVVSLLLPAGTLCISSHSPLDLFAYPAYSVKLNPASPISNSTAEAILAGNDRAAHNTAEDEDEESTITRSNDELQLRDERRKSLGLHDDHDHLDGQSDNEHDQHLNGPSKAYLMRSSSNGQAYLCTVPQLGTLSTSSPANKSADLVKGTSSSSNNAHDQSQSSLQRPPAPTTEAERKERKLKNEADKKEAFERGLALLEPLKGSCLYLTQGWFTYAFCYGSEIRQFHAVKNPNPSGPPLIEDLTQDAYTLGLWSNRLTENEGLFNVKKARALGSLREILASEDKSEENSLELVNGGRSTSKNNNDDEDSIGDEKRYLVQRWTGGTLCDKTGVDRSIEVQFHCNSQSSDKIFLIRETAICEYVMVIHTPRLCGEPIFVGGSSSAADDAAEKKRKELNVIECRPVVRDELYLQYINAGKVDQTGHGDRELPAASQMQDGQPLQEGAGNVGQTPQQDQPVSQEADSPSRYESASTQAPLKDDTVSQDKSQQGQDTTSGPAESPDTSEVEEFILGSYVLAYDRNSGEMTVNPDPEDVIKDEVNSGKTQVDGQKDDISQKEAEAMQALLLEFRRSLEDMMRNVGGVLQGARDEAVDVYDTIKKVQDAYEAAATGGASASSVKDGEGPVAGGESEGGKEVHQSVKQHNKGDEQQARFTRTGAHNHREIVEQYLKGQIGGLIPNKKGKAHRKGGATAPQLHRHREPVQQKIGTPQFRNMKRAFEQKWDDDNENEGSNSLSNEGKSGTEDKVKNVAVAAGAEARGHDEL